MLARGAMDSTWVESSYSARRDEPPVSMTRYAPSKFEFKVTVLPHEEAAVRAELEHQEAAFRKREVYFYDTPDLALKRRHIFLRARTTQGKEPDATVKLRPGTPVPAWHAARYEIDVIGDNEVGSLKLDRPKGEVDAADIDSRPRKLFNGAQEDLIPHVWPDLKVLGPIHAHVWTLKFDTVPLELDVEEWTVSGGPHFLELSFKADPADKVAARNGFRALLERLDIGPNGRDDPKTEIVLKHFAERL
jgi:hypothetical protein